jgi:hypothetical protein
MKLDCLVSTVLNRSFQLYPTDVATMPMTLLVIWPFESLDVLIKLLYSSSVDIRQRILIIDVMIEAAQELAETKIVRTKQRHGNLIYDTSPSGSSDIARAVEAADHTKAGTRSLLPSKLDSIIIPFGNM